MKNMRFTMKHVPSRLYPVLTLAAALAFAGGCGKSDKTTPAAGGDSKPANVLGEAQKAAEATAAQAKEAAGKAVAEAQQQAGEAASAVQAQAQNVIDQVKAMVSEKKYVEASKLLQEKLATLKLTPEQQKLVD